MEKKIQTLRLFLAILLVIAAGCLFAAEAMTACDEAQAFYEEYLRFDYCGISGIVHPERGVYCESFLKFWVKEEPDRIQREKEFYVALKRFEAAATGGQSAAAAACEVGRQLLVMKDFAKSSFLWWQVSSVEYSLLRILDSETSQVGIPEIETALPDGLFDELGKLRQSERCKMHKAFRNMIVVSWALKAAKKDKGGVPKELRDLGLDEKWLAGVDGAALEYRVVDGVWQLFSPGAPGGKDKGRFNEYVPVMHAPGVRFWPQASCLWLSSEYSAKRRHLYETGTLYDAKSPCACRLEGGCITRPGRDSRATAH